ncbi:hypothetical protein GCM10007921_43230 [Tritonibacter mobilis]|nr:hypothetical protein GCM10007921_43230 [Tritonibacter mobilis]
MRWYLRYCAARCASRWREQFPRVSANNTPNAQNKKAPDLVYPVRFAGYASDLTGHEYRDFQMEGGAVGSGEWGGLRPLATFISNKT